jgi:hypothetical protein
MNRSTSPIARRHARAATLPLMSACLLAFAIAPAAASGAMTSSEAGLPVEVRQQLEELRLATIAFHSREVANAAGWEADLSGCVESPMGGMGHHIANPSRLGDADVSLFSPEVLLYAPRADGSMEFLGVEYIVPAPLWNASTPPRLMGQDFHYNPQLDIWALHVWSAKPNPEGIFADWNPDVTCQFAD